MKKSTKIKGILLLVFIAFIWGVAFSAQDVSGSYMGPFAFTTVRYFFAAISALVAMLFFERKAEDKAKHLRSIFAGILCGGVMFCAYMLQQCGIKVSGESGKAGFITSLYILAVPLFGVFAKKFPKANVWAGVVLAVVGMFLLTIKEANGGLSTGEILLLISVIFWALHIIFIGYFAKDVYSARFSMVQFLTCSVFAAWAIALGADSAFGFPTPSFKAMFGSVTPALCLVYAGFISAGLGYTLQSVAQKRTDPISASLVLSLESVFAVFAQTVILRDPLSVKEYIGCLIIFCGIIISQLPAERFRLKGLKNGLTQKELDR